MIYFKLILNWIPICLTVASCSSTFNSKQSEVRVLSEAIKEVLHQSFMTKFNNFHIVTSVEVESVHASNDLIAEIIANIEGRMSVQVEEYSFVVVPKDERK